MCQAYKAKQSSARIRYGHERYTSALNPTLRVKGTRLQPYMYELRVGYWLTHNYRNLDEASTYDLRIGC